MMKFLSTPHHEQITLVIDQNSITCGWLQQRHARGPLHLRAYEKITLDTPITPHCFFNPTHIGFVIDQFIKKHVPNPATISCAFAPSIITERLTKLPHATPHPHDLPKERAPHTLWDYVYLYPVISSLISDEMTDRPHISEQVIGGQRISSEVTGRTEYVFYVCNVAQSLLLQYKLIALTHKLELLTTTSQTAALLLLYRYMHHHAFRSAQLGVDMQRCNNTPELLFSDEMLRRLVTIPPDLACAAAQEKKALLTMCGLFVSK